MTQPNILLIQTDQQTAETLSLYGNSALHTPALESLAQRESYLNKPSVITQLARLHVRQ